jgi:hypothetical protein
MPTWIIDALEEDTARIEEDGTRVIHVPCSILPEGAREGDVLSVDREDRRVTITIDRGATKAAMERSRQQVKRAAEASRKRDRGGDITL